MLEIVHRHAPLIARSVLSDDLQKHSSALVEYLFPGSQICACSRYVSLLDYTARSSE